jgi:hypothetical protein
MSLPNTAFDVTALQSDSDQAQAMNDSAGAYVDTPGANPNLNAYSSTDDAYMRVESSDGHEDEF